MTKMMEGANNNNSIMVGLFSKQLVFRWLVLLLLVCSVSMLSACGSSSNSAGSSNNSSENGGGGTGGGGSNSGSGTKSGVYSQNGGTLTQDGKTYTSTTSNESAVYVYGSGTYTLSNGTLSKTGDTTDSSNGDFNGLNAIALAEGGSTINLTGCNLSSSAQGANGAFAYGANGGATINLDNCTITTTKDSSRGVDATYGGVINISNSSITTSGAHCAALASDRYDTDPPKVNADNITGNTSGQGSPGIYCTGTFVVKNSTFKATGSEAAVIEGTNSITLTDTDLSSTYPASSNNHGVMIYQSMSGDAQGNTGTFTMTGGKLLKTGGGPLLLNTNDEGIFNLKNVTLEADSGIILESCKCDWTASATNGGITTFSADDQTMVGDFVVDNYGKITATFKNGSRLTGGINNDNAAGIVSLTLNSSSDTWTATKNSYVDILNGVVLFGSTLQNVDAVAGITIHYGSGTGISGNYTLASGGKLQKD